MAADKRRSIVSIINRPDFIFECNLSAIIPATNAEIGLSQKIIVVKVDDCIRLCPWTSTK